MIAQGKHYTTKHPPNDIDNLLRRSVESAADSCHTHHPKFRHHPHCPAPIPRSARTTQGHIALPAAPEFLEVLSRRSGSSDHRTNKQRKLSAASSTLFE